MRFLRMLFVVVLALILVGLALANRGMVTLNAFPAQFGAYLGWGTWSVQLPLFLVIFLAMVFGMVAGLIWEWLREAHLRRESAARAEQLARLEREVGSLRTAAPVAPATPRDEILAIVDAPNGVTRLPAPR